MKKLHKITESVVVCLKKNKKLSTYNTDWLYESSY